MIFMVKHSANKLVVFGVTPNLHPDEIVTIFNR